MKHKYATGTEARNHLRGALTKIAEGVGSTLGPGGRSFAFDKKNTNLRNMASFTKDGLTVLRALRFPGDPVSQAVLQYCGQASSNSVLASGDGTTSTVIMASKIADIISRTNVKLPQAYARKLMKYAKESSDEIRRMALTGDEVVRNVALTSTNGDEELTDVVIEAIKRSSAYGSILSIKNPMAKERYRMDIQEGYSNCQGYAYNQTMALSADEAAASGRAISWKNPYVVVFDGVLAEINQLNSILDVWARLVGKRSGNLVILCHNIHDAMANVIIQRNRQLLSAHGISIFPVRTKLSAEPQSSVQILRDLSSHCGITSDKIIDGGNYSNIDESFFGDTKSISISQTSTAFLGRADNHYVPERIVQNTALIEEQRDLFSKDLATIRNAELAEGLVNVTIGGGLLPELQEREDRFDDASKAAQAAMRSGAVPGCGASYVVAAKNIVFSKAGQSAFDHDFREAMETIHATVMKNYGEPLINHHPGGEICFDEGQTLSISDDGVVMGDAFEMGVLDSVETVCAVIENGIALGINIATMGGYSLRETAEEDII